MVQMPPAVQNLLSVRVLTAVRGVVTDPAIRWRGTPKYANPQSVFSSRKFSTEYVYSPHKCPPPLHIVEWGRFLVQVAVDLPRMVWSTSDVVLP